MQDKILDGNNKTNVLSTACPISDLFRKAEMILGIAYAHTISVLPCQMNQISDSSRPNNCIMYTHHRHVQSSNLYQFDVHSFITCIFTLMIKPQES